MQPDAQDQGQYGSGKDDLVKQEAAAPRAPLFVKRARQGQQPGHGGFIVHTTSFFRYPGGSAARWPVFYDGRLMNRSKFFRFSMLLAEGSLLGGCAAVNDATMRALATSTPALAVIGERVLSGEMLLYTDRSGRLQLHGGDRAGLSCLGSLRYTATTSGTMNLSCSDGTRVQLPFTALGETSGHGSLPGGSISFTYGLPAETARAWLSAPAGKRLVLSGDTLRME